jgi:hypothetical protein
MKNCTEEMALSDAREATDEDSGRISDELDDLFEEIVGPDGLIDRRRRGEGVDVDVVHVAEQILHEALNMGVGFFADASFEVFGVVGEGFDEFLAKSKGAVDGKEALGCVGIAV